MPKHGFPEQHVDGMLCSQNLYNNQSCLDNEHKHSKPPKDFIPLSKIAQLTIGGNVTNWIQIALRRLPMRNGEKKSEATT